MRRAEAAGITGSYCMTLRSARCIGSICVFAGLAALVLHPYVINGLWADDSLNSQTWGLVRRFNTTAWSFSIRVTHAWLTQYGRLMLSWPVLYEFFYLVRDARLIRVIDVGLFLSNVALICYLLRRVGIPRATVGIFLLLLCAILQIRGGSDPLAAYATFCQLHGLAICAALLLLVRWKETAKLGWLIGASLLAAFSIAFYELNVIFVPIAIGVVLTARHQKRIRSLAVVCIPFLGLFLISAYISLKATNPYAGTQIGSIRAVPLTYAKQFFAVVPGSFFVFTSSWVGLPAAFGRIVLAQPVVWVVAALAAFGFFSALYRIRTSQRMWSYGVAWAALAFMVIPPAPIAISAGYQSTLVWGEAHIPIYYQYFGVALLTALGIERFTQNRTTLKAVMLSLAFCAATASTWLLNERQVSVIDQTVREPRTSFVSALNSGLFDSATDGDVVEIVDQPMFINGNLIYQTIQKNVSIPHEDAIYGWFQSVPRSDAKHFRVFRDVSDHDKWKMNRVE